MPGGQALPVCEVHAAGYRSLRSIRFPLGALTVSVGANGAGKTNLYRALRRNLDRRAEAHRELRL